MTRKPPCTSKKASAVFKERCNLLGQWWQRRGGKKYPKISEGTATEEPSSNVHVPPPKQVLQFGEKELQKLKVAELVKLLVDIVGHQPSLPKKPRKHELLSRILDVATLRVD